MLFQCSLEILALSISKKRDCLLSIAIAMAMFVCLDALCFEVIVIRLEISSSDRYACHYTKDRVVPHRFLCNTTPRLCSDLYFYRSTDFLFSAQVF